MTPEPVHNHLKRSTRVWSCPACYPDDSIDGRRIGEKYDMKPLVKGLGYQPDAFTSTTYQFDPETMPASMDYRGCVACGGKFESNSQHARFHNIMVSREEAQHMSSVLWCDTTEIDELNPHGIGHAFKAGQPGSQTMTGTQINEDGFEESVRMDLCAAHTPQGALKRAQAMISATKSESPINPPEEARPYSREDIYGTPDDAPHGTTMAARNYVTGTMD